MTDVRITTGHGTWVVPAPTTASDLPNIEFTVSPRIGGAHWGHLSGEQKANAVAALRNAGMSADRLKGIAPAAKTPEPTGTEGFVRPRQLTRTDAEASRMANALIAAGMDPERVKAAAQDDGYHVAGEVTREGAQEEMLFGVPAPGEIDAHFPPYTATLAEQVGQPVDALQDAMKHGACAMGLNRAVASTLIEWAIEDAEMYSRMDAGQRAAWDARQKDQLQAVFGDLAKAQRGVVATIERWNAANPALLQALLKAGLFRSARVQGQLALIAKRNA